MRLRAVADAAERAAAESLRLHLQQHFLCRVRLCLHIRYLGLQLPDRDGPPCRRLRSLPLLRRAAPPGDEGCRARQGRQRLALPEGAGALAAPLAGAPWVLLVLVLPEASFRPIRQGVHVAVVPVAALPLPPAKRANCIGAPSACGAASARGLDHRQPLLRLLPAWRIWRAPRRGVVLVDGVPLAAQRAAEAQRRLHLEALRLNEVWLRGAAGAGRHRRGAAEQPPLRRRLGGHRRPPPRRRVDTIPPRRRAAGAVLLPVRAVRAAAGALVGGFRAAGRVVPVAAALHRGAALRCTGAARGLCLPCELDLHGLQDPHHAVGAGQQLVLDRRRRAEHLPPLLEGEEVVHASNVERRHRPLVEPPPLAQRELVAKDHVRLEPLLVTARDDAVDGRAAVHLQDLLAGEAAVAVAVEHVEQEAGLLVLAGVGHEQQQGYGDVRHADAPAAAPVNALEDVPEEVVLVRLHHSNVLHDAQESLEVDVRRDARHGGAAHPLVDPLLQPSPDVPAELQVQFPPEAAHSAPLVLLPSPEG
mmetsp:Transcript_1195/g.2980  ORF Transcript_1195/g.2980 Transcript_1195/m.2980 type:complete len:531 (+) Transcript_1195:129-1721(+)